MTIGKRLKEERERLKISQTSFAEIAGVHRKSQANYETDASTPDLAYIEALKAAKIDVDVRYITEGKYTLRGNWRAAPSRAYLALETQYKTDGRFRQYHA